MVGKVIIYATQLGIAQKHIYLHTSNTEYHFKWSYTRNSYVNNTLSI